VTTREKAIEDLYVKQLLARIMYLQWCKYKGYTPRTFPYVDAGSRDYAGIAVDTLGYDDDSIAEMEAMLEKDREVA
jgi:hypothetical protein